MSKKNKPETTQDDLAEDAVEENACDAAEENAEGEAAPAEADPLVKAQQEAEANHDLYLRARADLDNFRRRAQKDKEELSKFANENLLRELLPVIDNLSRAVEHAGESDSQSLLEGVNMTLDQFGKVLEKFGVEPVEALGQPFDPDRHEAMGQLETDEQPPNTVVQEMQRGYMLNQRLLRPALVMIAKAPDE